MSTASFFSFSSRHTLVFSWTDPPFSLSNPLSPPSSQYAPCTRTDLSRLPFYSDTTRSFRLLLLSQSLHNPSFSVPSLPSPSLFLHFTNLSFLSLFSAPTLSLFSLRFPLSFPKSSKKNPQQQRNETSKNRLGLFHRTRHDSNRDQCYRSRVQTRWSRYE